MYKSQHDDSLDEGWYALRQRGQHALTHFEPPGAGAEEAWHHVAHWAVLPAELWETNHSVELSLEIPGMKAEHLDVEITADNLVVRGERLPEAEDAAGNRHFIRERAYGRFQRTFRLPASVDEDRARARYRDGVLRISLPKAEARRDHRVSIET